MIKKRKSKIPKQGIELFIIAGLSILVYIVASQFDILEKIVEFSRKHETWELDEFIVVFIFLVFSLMIYISRRIREFMISKAILEEKNKELLKALDEIQKLKGLIPICASCKKIRDDKGFWQQVETYIEKFSKIEFSHGLCPDCAKEIYPFIFGDKPEKRD